MQTGVVGKRGGTYVCMEGPQFSTTRGVEPLPQLGRGRDRHDQSAGGQAGARGGDLLRDGGDGDRLRLLARRARRRDGGQIVAVLHQNAANAAKVRARRGAAMPEERTCACASAMQYAILTDRDAIPAATREEAGSADREISVTRRSKVRKRKRLHVDSGSGSVLRLTPLRLRAAGWTMPGRRGDAFFAGRQLLHGCARDRRGGRRLHGRATRPC